MGIAHADHFPLIFKNEYRINSGRFAKPECFFLETGKNLCHLFRGHLRQRYIMTRIVTNNFSFPFGTRLFEKAFFRTDRWGLHAHYRMIIIEYKDILIQWVLASVHPNIARAEVAGWIVVMRISYVR